jgi:hypothetical protein
MGLGAEFSHGLDRPDPGSIHSSNERQQNRHEERTFFGAQQLAFVRGYLDAHRFLSSGVNWEPKSRAPNTWRISISASALSN